MEAQDVAVLDGVGDGVGVQLLLEQVRRGAHRGLASSSIFCRVALASKMGVPVKPKSCALGKNALMALWFSPNCERWHSSKMKTMRLSRQRFELFLVGGLAVLAALLVALAVFVQRQAELLDGGDDDLVGVVL